MYESTYETVKSSFQPLIELAELNRKTLQKMSSVQTSYLTDCISSSIKQVKTLAESGSPQRATELAFEMSKEFESKLNGATEQNLAALAELRAAYSALINSNCSGSYARIVELCTMKEGFAPAAFKVATSITQQPVKAAPAKQATVKKTPAKVATVDAPAAAVVADKKPAAPAIKAKVVAPVVAVKAVPAVETKPAAAAEAKVEAKTEVKAEAQKSEAVKPAPAAVAKKATTKRAAAKPVAKKTTAKPAVKKN